MHWKEFFSIFFEPCDWSLYWVHACSWERERTGDDVCDMAKPWEQCERPQVQSWCTPRPSSLSVMLADYILHGLFLVSKVMNGFLTQVLCTEVKVPLEWLVNRVPLQLFPVLLERMHSLVFLFKLFLYLLPLESGLCRVSSHDPSQILFYKFCT